MKSKNPGRGEGDEEEGDEEEGEGGKGPAAAMVAADSSALALVRIGSYIMHEKNNGKIGSLFAILPAQKSRFYSEPTQWVS